MYGVLPLSFLEHNTALFVKYSRPLPSYCNQCPTHCRPGNDLLLSPTPATLMNMPSVPVFDRGFIPERLLMMMSLLFK